MFLTVLIVSDHRYGQALTFNWGLSINRSSNSLTFELWARVTSLTSLAASSTAATTLCMRTDKDRLGPTLTAAGRSRRTATGVATPAIVCRLQDLRELINNRPAGWTGFNMRAPLVGVALMRPCPYAPCHAPTVGLLRNCRSPLIFFACFWPFIESSAPSVTSSGRRKRVDCLAQPHQEHVVMSCGS